MLGCEDFREFLYLQSPYSMYYVCKLSFQKLDYTINQPHYQPLGTRLHISAVALLAAALSKFRDSGFLFCILQLSTLCPRPFSCLVCRKSAVVISKTTERATYRGLQQYSGPFSCMANATDIVRPLRQPWATSAIQIMANRTR